MLRLKLRLLKDNITLYAIMIMMSLLLAGILGNAFGGDYKGLLLVEDVSGSVANADIIHALEQEDSFNIKLVSHQEGIDQVAKRQALMLIVLKDVPKIIELKPSVERYQVERLLASEMQSQAELNSYSDKVYQVISQNADTKVSRDDLINIIKNTVRDQTQTKKVFNLNRQTFKSDPLSNYDPKIHYTVGMTLFFVTYSLMFTVGDYLEDRRLHTLDRMKVSPVSRFQLLLSNILPAFLIGSLQIAIMILSGKFLFGIRWGSQFGMIILVSMVYIFTMTSLSFFIVSMVKNMSQLGAISPVILTGMGMLGGCMWPLEIIQSKTLIFLSTVTPHRWAISGIESLMINGHTSSETTKAVIILLIMGAVYMVLAERMLAYKNKG